ncbi:MAG: pilus assembly protein TadG-related protein [Candidatus Sericytochromatia bacterium]|nr:pilus assembly protein TadG-related protein [Candidatus Sericytochromatia bacterium]
MRDRRSPRGQSLVYFTLVLAVIVGVLYATYDLARLTTAKMQAQTAVDAAALAGTAVKVSIHHTRSLAYAAMTGQATLARLKFAKALAVVGSKPPLPGQPYLAAEEFDKWVGEANAHVARLRRLRAGLVAYNSWVAREGPAVVADAARLAFNANVSGMNAAMGEGTAANARNLSLLAGPRNLPENGGQFAAGRFVGGVNYPGEAAGAGGAAGKTLVWAEPVYRPLGSALLGASHPLVLPSVAAAGLVPAGELKAAEPGSGEAGAGGVGLRWYTPRLLQVGGLNGYPHELLH